LATKIPDDIRFKRGLLSAKHIRELGSAVWLLHFFIDRQTDRNGLVHYGRPITYEWISDQLAEDDYSVAERTLRRWNAQLQKKRYVAVQLVMYGGMRVQVLRPKKFGVQLAMPFPPVENHSDKPVENLCGSLSLRRPRSDQKWPHKDTGIELEKRKSAGAPIDFDRDGDRQGRLEFMNLLRELARRKAV
jgi:hypothetical protein